MKYLLTGASRGLGHELGKELVRRGHTVTSLNRSPSGIPGVRDISCDLESPQKRNEVLQQIETPEVVILNAACIEEDLVEGTIDRETARRVFEINVLANIDILSHFLSRNEEMKFVAISSLSSIRPLGVRGVAYPASKAALNLVFESLGLYYPRCGFTTVLLGRVKGGKFKTGVSYSTCVEKILRGAERGDSRIYIPRVKSYIFNALRLIPDKILRPLTLAPNRI